MAGTRWTELYSRFYKLKEITGSNKSSSYVMEIRFAPDFTGSWELLVEFGGYDIENWPRHLTIGPFKTEEEALKAAESKIEEAEALVKRGENPPALCFKCGGAIYGTGKVENCGYPLCECSQPLV